ncbi:AI-2E family transporter [Ornithinimicrobium panacihumi]|uniref:AI-2E family transporter n=1 Tax=Ornithinimicrobium panacihumi TaxID=2008449 RepID=UPI003F8BA807
MNTAHRGGPAPDEEARPPLPEADSEEERPEMGASPSDRTRPDVDRGMLILHGMRGAAAWAWRFLLVVAALAVLLFLLGKLWVGVLPLLLALLVTTVLWPAVRWLVRHGVNSAVAALLVLLVTVLTVVGTLTAIAPSVVEQGGIITRQAGEGLQVVLDWVSGPPLNLQNEQVTEYVDTATAWLQERSSQIAAGVLTGVSTVGSVLVTTALTLVLTFFFLKDGHRFSPWVRTIVGPSAGMHLVEAMARVWRTLGGFIKAQALVSAVDAVFIGLGLLLLGVPMAFVLAIITFFAGFIPIVGAVTAGLLATLVALVSQGWVTALWVLALILVVQQVEGNVLQPFIQGRTMELHPGIIILVVTAGGTQWGIVGAFLAVPLTAALVTLLRYGNEHLDLRTGALRAEDVKNLTPDGERAAALAEGRAPVFKMRAQQAYEQAEGERGIAQTLISGPTSDLAQALKERILHPLMRKGDRHELQEPDDDPLGPHDGRSSDHDPLGDVRSAPQRPADPSDPPRT